MLSFAETLSRFSQTNLDPVSLTFRPAQVANGTRRPVTAMAVNFNVCLARIVCSVKEIDSLMQVAANASHVTRKCATPSTSLDAVANKLKLTKGGKLAHCKLV